MLLIHKQLGNAIHVDFISVWRQHNFGGTNLTMIVSALFMGQSHNIMIKTQTLVSELITHGVQKAVFLQKKHKEKL